VRIYPPGNLSSRIEPNERERESGVGEAGEKVAEKIEAAEVRTKVVSHYITVSGSRSYPGTRYSITG